MIGSANSTPRKQPTTPEYAISCPSTYLLLVLRMWLVLRRGYGDDVENIYLSGCGGHVGDGEKHTRLSHSVPFVSWLPKHPHSLEFPLLVSYRNNAHLNPSPLTGQYESEDRSDTVAVETRNEKTAIPSDWLCESAELGSVRFWMKPKGRNELWRTCGRLK